MEGRKLEIIGADGSSALFDLEIPTPYVFVNISGQGKPNVTIFSTQAPAQHGSTATATLFEPRELTFSGYVWGADRPTMDQRLMALNRTINPARGASTLIYHTTYGQYAIAAIARDQIAYDARFTASGQMAGHFTPVSITFECPDPMWRSVEQYRSAIRHSRGLFKFPFRLGAQFGSGGYKQAVVNLGDMPAPVVIEIQGPAAKPTIHNNTTGKSLSLTKPLLENEILRIDTAPQRQRVLLRNLETGAEQNAFGYIDITTGSHAYWQLAPGENEIEYDSGDDWQYGTVALRWYDRISGV